MREGCPNCESTLQLRGNNDAIQECTSQVFEGLIAVRDPAASWVARWQRLDNYVAGTYATKVTGTVSGNSILWAQSWVSPKLLGPLVPPSTDQLIRFFASTASGIHHQQSRGFRYQICSVRAVRIPYSPFYCIPCPYANSCLL